MLIPRIKNVGIDNFNEIQKIHKEKSLRLGGIIIFLPLVGAVYFNDYLSIKLFYLFICLLPFFVISLSEDLFSNVSPFLRLIGAILSSSLIVFVTNTKLGEIDIQWANELLEINFISYLVTIIGISATANAWNFIDGLNGLSSGLAMVVLYIICIFSFSEGIYDVYFLSAAIIFSFVGFWIVNISTGKLFLGDAGSYSLGIVIAWSGVEITSNHSRISSWEIFFIILYPAIELMYSVFRRLIKRKIPI